MSGRSWVRTVWVAAGVVVLVVFLFLVRDILPPFLIALATAALLDPLLDWMQRRGWSRPTAALLTFLLFLAVFLGVAMVLLPLAVTQATDLVQNLPAYYERFTDWAREYTSGHHALLVRLRLPTTIDAWLQNYHSQIESFLRALVARTVTILMTSLSKAVWLAIIPIATFYLMKDIDKIRFRVLSLLPDAQRDWVSRMGVEVGAVFVSYLRGLCIVCARWSRAP